MNGNAEEKKELTLVDEVEGEPMDTDVVLVSEAADDDDKEVPKEQETEQRQTKDEEAANIE